MQFSSFFYVSNLQSVKFYIGRLQSWQNMLQKIFNVIWYCVLDNSWSLIKKNQVAGGYHLYVTVSARQDLEGGFDCLAWLSISVNGHVIYVSLLPSTSSFKLNYHFRKLVICGCGTITAPRSRSSSMDSSGHSLVCLHYNFTKEKGLLLNYKLNQLRVSLQFYGWNISRLIIFSSALISLPCPFARKIFKSVIYNSSENIKQMISRAALNRRQNRVSSVFNRLRKAALLKATASSGNFVTTSLGHTLPRLGFCFAKASKH